MRFDARPVPRSRLSLKGVGFAALAVSIFMGAAAAVIQLYVREKAVGKEEAETLSRRLFYRLVPGERITVFAADVSDRLIASVVVRNIAPKTDVHLRLEWLDRSGRTLAVSGWRRPISEKEAPTADDSLERYLLPGGRALAGPRNLTLRRDDFPPGTDRVAITLVEPRSLEIFIRFYTRTQLQPGAVHQEAALLEAREQRLEARTALPSTLAPQELIDRLTGWKWLTVAAEPRAWSVHLFRRDVAGGGTTAEGDEPVAARTPGLRVGPGRPLAFEVVAAGEYVLRSEVCGPGELEVEKRVPGRLAESARVRLAPGAVLWRERLEPPATLVVRKVSGGQAEVRLALAPADGSAESAVPQCSQAAMAWLLGPLAEVAPARTAGSGYGLAGRLVAAPVEGPAGTAGTDVLRFDWSAGAAAAGATVKLRVRAVVTAGETPPQAVALRDRIVGAGRLAIADERIDVPLAPPDLERVPEGWCPLLEGLPQDAAGTEAPPDGPLPAWVVTGSGELYIDIPDEGSVLEVRADAPVLLVPTHTLPQLRPVMQVPPETPDRTLCYVDPEPPDDSRIWHYLRPSNEGELRAAGAGIVVDLPSPAVRAPLRGSASADALWDREAAMPRRHAGSALALWPARPRGAISRNRLFPWSAPWPESAYRPLAEGEPPSPVLEEPGLPDPADLLVRGADGLFSREPWVDGAFPDGAEFINRPVRGDANPDPRFARLLRRAWRALPDLPAEFEVAHDGAETWVSLNVQLEGEQVGPLDVDIESPSWAARRRAWPGGRTEPRRRIVGAEASGETVSFIDAAPRIVGCTLQARLRFGPDLPAGDYIVRVRPLSGGAWLSAGVSRLGGRAIQNGTTWTWRTEGLGGRSLGIESPGRDPARDLAFEAIVPGRGPARLTLEPVLGRWTVAIPADCVALRGTALSAGPGPILVTLERPGAPKPLPLSTAETRDSWRRMLPAIDDTYRNPGAAEETARFRLLWEAPDEAALPPSELVEASVGGPAGRARVAIGLKWMRDPRTFDADRPGAVLWTSRVVELVIPSGGSDAAVRAWTEGFWISWERKAGPPRHVAIHTAGTYDAFPFAAFMTRSRRTTGLWDGEPNPDYLWPTRVTWTTPWEFSTGASRELPELTLVPVDLTLLGATEQVELSRPAAWRKPGLKSGPIWRPLPLGQDLPCIVGDALGRAKFGSLRLSFEDVAIGGGRAVTVEVLVDGRLAATETLFRTRGELSIPSLLAGEHRVEVRPAEGVAAYRCGRWQVRTIASPADGDRQISSVWRAPSDGEVRIEAEAPKEGEQLVLEVLTSRGRRAEWGAWTFDWEGLFVSDGAESWVPLGAERHWVSPGAGREATRTGADGTTWIPVFRMAWELDRFTGATRVRGRLRGALLKGDAVHLFRMALEGGDLSDVDEVRKK
ncbi:MAG: hypothetical protein IT452_04415 [Planctomycetia bacterium]|nr:hypothetical protein [Planctomycetia bacterium]